MKTSSAAHQSYWDSFHECMESNLKYDPNQILFKELFEKYIKKGGSCFEIGCHPGNFLIYFAKEFGYKVSGIDMTPSLLKKTPAYIKSNGVVADELICQDFLTYESTKTFDLVCSFGFVEHFSNYEEIIKKHISCVKEGGKLVITAPNLRGLHHIIYLLTDRVSLSAHVLSAMNLRKWRNLLEANNMRLLYHDYYQTAGYVGSPIPIKYRYQRVLIKLYKDLCSKIDERFNYPNRLLSPFLVSISEKIEKM